MGSFFPIQAGDGAGFADNDSDVGGDDFDMGPYNDYNDAGETLHGMLVTWGLLQC